MDKEDPKFVRLHEAVEKSCLLFTDSRASRVEAVRQYVGSHYSGER